MPYDTKAVANYFIDYAEQNGESLTPMKLQKLIYFAHGWHLALTDGEKLINEMVEAWDYGPVIPSLYNEFREFGRYPITRKAKHSSFRGTKLISEEPYLPDEANFAKELLKKIWDVYGGYNGVQLSNVAHENGSPWYQITQQFPNGIPKNLDLPDNLIQDYFTRQMEE